MPMSAKNVIYVCVAKRHRSFRWTSSVWVPPCGTGGVQEVFLHLKQFKPFKPHWQGILQTSAGRRPGRLEVHQPQRYQCAFAHIHHIHLTVPLCYHYEYICIYNYVCLCKTKCIFKILYIQICVCVSIYIIYYNIHTYVTCVRASYLYLYCRTSVPRHQDIIRHPHPSESSTSFIPRSSFVLSTPRSIDLP